jgi:hypothetical protein
MSAIRDAAYNVVHDYPGGAVSLAPRLGKSSTSLSHEVNGTGTAKLGLEDAVKITSLSGDRRILNAFAAECECMVLPLPNADDVDSDVMRQVAILAQNFSELISGTLDANADGKITGNELATIESLWSKLVVQGQALVRELRIQHAAGKPPHMQS